MEFVSSKRAVVKKLIRKFKNIYKAERESSRNYEDSCANVCSSDGDSSEEKEVPISSDFKDQEPLSALEDRNEDKYEDENFLDTYERENISVFYKSKKKRVEL